MFYKQNAGKVIRNGLKQKENGEAAIGTYAGTLVLSGLLILKGYVKKMEAGTQSEEHLKTWQSWRLPRISLDSLMGQDTGLTP